MCRVALPKGTRVFLVNPPAGEVRWGCEPCARRHLQLVRSGMDLMAPGSVWRRRKQKRRR